MIARMGLSNRLILIIVSINLLILVIVAALANFFSEAALREQAIERFDSKSTNAFLYVDERLDAFLNSANALAAWVETYDALNVSNDVQLHIVDALSNDNDTLIHRVSIQRPDNTALVINFPNPMQADQNARRVITLEDQLNNSNFYNARESIVWFQQSPAIFDSQAQDAITYAIPYHHATGDGLIWFDISLSALDALSLEALNREGLLFESNTGYSLIVDNNQIPVLAQNLDLSQTEDINRTTRDLFERYSETDRSADGLFHFLDPFNADVRSLFKIQTLTANNWSFITVFPEDEIPVLPNNIFIPILLVGAVGLATLIFVVNRFIENDVVTPLVDLGRSASEIGDGNLRFVVFHLDKLDEIGRLATAMDSMKSRLRESYDALQKWNRTLEERVEERTVQLAESRQEAEVTAQQLRAIYEESITVVNTSQLQPVLDAFIERILPLMEATYCAVWLLDNERETIRLVATNDERRRRSGSDGVVTMHAGDGIVGQAVRLDQAVIVNDYDHYEHRIHLEDYYESGTPPFSRAVCAPLKFAGFAIGAVVVGRPADASAFGPTEERQLTLFTNIVSPSVRNAQLFVRLQEAVQEAKSANEVKTRFLASVTHELRTPLNLIINNMDFMRVGAFGEVNDDQVSRLNQTVRSAEHLLYLINDLLDVSKIEAGEMQLFIQNHEVYTMLEDAIDNAYALLDNDETKAGKLELRTEIEDGLPELPMDARRIRQVLNNLLSNAIKFTEAGFITMKVYKEENGVHFSVIDTGMGIPKAEMDKLFTAFERTTTAKQKAIEGTGLGLPISRFLVQQHGSDLTAVSDEGAGSTFAFTLPFETPENLGRMSLTDTQQITAILSSKNE
jgi:signal transduction histidine kinase/methyl-accepting chemotaxis protein